MSSDGRTATADPRDRESRTPGGCVDLPVVVRRKNRASNNSMQRLLLHHTDSKGLGILESGQLETTSLQDGRR
jgi:hypothetical protein